MLGALGYVVNKTEMVFTLINPMEKIHFEGITIKINNFTEWYEVLWWHVMVLMQEHDKICPLKRSLVIL